MNASRTLPLLVLLTLQIGCQSAQIPIAAVLPEPTPAEIGELEQTISAALGGRSIRLADDAFSGSSVLTLEPAGRQTPAGRLATGTMTEAPEQFQLLRTADGCALERLQTGQRFALTTTRCRAE